MIKNVLFDIGNVLVGFDWTAYIHTLFTDEALIEKLRSAVWGDGRWDRLDWGADFNKVLTSMINAEPECEDELRLMFSHIGGCVSRYDTSIEWITDLKARGYNVYYLSNYSRTIMNAQHEALDFLPLMDGGVFSCDVYLLKPDPAIYRYILRKYSLNPAECVFIDDLERNIQAAINCGMYGIRCDNIGQAQRDLNKLLKEE
mgnify:CR=1 FL=1